MNKEQLQSEIETNLETLKAIDFSIHTSTTSFYNDLQAGLITEEKYNEQVAETENFYAPRVVSLNNENAMIREILVARS